jgi:hypothetical protein
MTITEKIDYMLARLKEQDEKNHDLEHDLPHFHFSDLNDTAEGRSVRVHGAAGTWETSEIRDQIARLADIVRDLADETARAFNDHASAHGDHGI